MRFIHYIICLFIALFALLSPAGAKVNMAIYGNSIPVNNSWLEQATSKGLDSMVRLQPAIKNAQTIVAIEKERSYVDKTADFYLLLFLCLLLGLIRLMEPKYFHNLWRAFRNPTLSNRQLKEQVGGSLSSLLMNIYFGLILGAYIYYLVKMFIPQRTGAIAPSLLILMLIGGVMCIYLIKYAVIRFSGWAFKVDGITEHYIFNVFLINKVIAILLLPFTILLAFADPAVSGPAVIVSLILIGLLLINRYTRSWQVFGSFFQYSKFHFFTYLCASELLPLAVLMKLLIRGLMDR